MDFKALQQLQTQNLGARRQAEAIKLYQQGLEAFAQATASRFRDKQALRNAFDKWMDALKQHRQNPDPYIGLGYIFLILNDHRAALMYFKSAQGIQPDHPDAALLIQYLVDLTSGRAPQPPAGLPAGSDGSDYDALYDRAEQLLDLHLRQLRQLPGLKPSPHADERQQQEQICADQGQLVAEVKQMLKTLAVEIDTSELEKQLAVLETALRRLQTVKEASASFARLAQEMQACSAEADRALAKVPMPGAEALIESLLDRCDAFADQLDELENRRHDITALKPYYDELVESLNALQDKLDE